MSKTATGTVIADPAKTAAVNEQLRFQPLQFMPVIADGAGDLAEWEHFGSVLLGVGFKTGDTVSMEGSAVMIGPGLALAAKHVIQPRLERLMASEDAAFLGAVTNDGLQLWSLHQVVMSDTDVVILRVDLASKLPPENLFHTAALTTRMPKVGELVQIAGFRSEGVSEGEVLGQVRIGVGQVTAVYLNGRDSVMLPHPCFEVKCLTIGGMSGGPAFDERGHLLGVLASSIEHEDGPSYVSLALPVVAQAIETFWLPGALDLPTSIMELVSKGLIGMERPEALTLSDSGTLLVQDWEWTVAPDTDSPSSP